MKRLWEQGIPPPTGCVEVPNFEGSVSIVEMTLLAAYVSDSRVQHLTDNADAISKFGLFVVGSVGHDKVSPSGGSHNVSFQRHSGQQHAG